MSSGILLERLAVIKEIELLLQWYRAPRKAFHEPENTMGWSDFEEFSPLNRLLLGYVSYVIHAVSHDDERVDRVPVPVVMMTLETVVMLIKQERSDEIWPLLRTTGIDLD